uniref:Tubulin polymerization-promoting protein family member 3-like protein n=1 Tax=Callorhinchus milii TaxID=7868 RepID=V9KZ87_CALMI
MAEAEGEAQKTFRRFAVLGDSKSSGRDMSGKNFAKLCRDCGIVDGRSVTGTDADITFSRVKARTSRAIGFEEFLRALGELSGKRFEGKGQKEAMDGMYGLIAGKEPLLTGITKTGKAGAVDRLTDSSRYTGSHKERFDESGKGKGKAGREELAEDTGFVGAYRGRGTFDDKVKGAK